MGELRPDLILVEFLMRFGFRFRDVGWKVVIPCEHYSESLAFPCMFLLCVGVSSRAAKEVFHFVIGRSYILIERLCIVPSPGCALLRSPCKIIRSFSYLIIQFSVVFHISVCPMGLEAVNW